MPDFKISLITATYNAETTISRCIESVMAQNCKNLEYIVVDGGSTDNTLQIISQYKDFIDIFISEPDKGVYDAINKGINRASGDVLGILNADDFFAGADILKSVTAVFEGNNIDILYGNLDYIKPNGAIIRKWRAKAYKPGLYNWGWMPAHPTFYCRRHLFNDMGLYSLKYGTAADYELMLRFMHHKDISVYYLNKVMVKMQCGGLSNKSPNSRIRAWWFDLKAMRNNKVLFPLLTLIIKPLRKIWQYF